MICWAQVLSGRHFPKAQLCVRETELTESTFSQQHDTEDHSGIQAMKINNNSSGGK